MEMTAKLSKKRVLAVYPEARYTDSGLGTGVIQADNGIIGESMINTEREGAEDAAWIDAASLLPEEKEPAPKEGERERPHQADCICRRCEDWDDAHEPAKVETGYALPPLNVTEKDRDLAKKQWPGVWPSKQEERAKVLARERQLKASLLREKGKDEEIERLKGLLREYYLSNCGDYGAKQCKHPFDCICVGERVKAAVTGKQP